MAAAMRRWVAGMMPKHCPQSPFPPSIYPTILQKVEGMKKIAPTEDTSKVLLGIEDKIKVYHRVWEANERKVQGLLRDGIGCQAFIIFCTIGSAAAVVKGAHVFYKFTEVSDQQDLVNEQLNAVN